MLTLWLTIAFAGYGDPHPEGIPTYQEREVHLWTNAVRSAPESFEADYDCDLSTFSTSQRTPQIPLWWHQGLGQAARMHTLDMEQHDNLSHTGSDGSQPSDRVEGLYSGWVGENIAVGYPTAWSAVIEGWMCSTGHRANIMDPGYVDLGTGVVGVWYTQNFGQRDFDTTAFAARTGIHLPRYPNAAADYQLSVYTEDVPPLAVRVVANGQPHPMSVRLGSETNGIYEAVEVPISEDCTAYWFEVEQDGGEIDRYPQDGAYGFGLCPWTDTAAHWLVQADIPALQPDPTPTSDEPTGAGCDHLAAGVGGGFWWVLLAAALRRRRG